MSFLSIDNNKKNMLWLFLIYTCSQGMLLLVTGRWWDDMTNVVRDVNALREMMMQAGAYPLGYWVDYLGWHLSVPKVTFVIYFISTICFYNILQAVGVTRQSSFVIAALYAVIPLNDARITWICFFYTISVCAFLVGVCLLIKMLHAHGLSKLILRVATMVLIVGISFWTQSLLVFYALALGYIVWQVGWWNSFKLYGDFWLAPLVFKVFKEIFAHPYGNYVGYNEITFLKLVRAVWVTVPASLHVVGGVLENAILSANASVIVLIIISAFIIRDIGNREYVQLGESSVKGVAYGFIILYLGLFAYVVVRGRYSLDLIGPSGRDMLLAPMGVSVILYYLPSMLHIRNTMRNSLYALFIFLCVIHTNKIYIEYQIEEYHQQALIKLLLENKEIEESQNVIMYINKIGSLNKLQVNRFYTLSGCATIAYGNESHFLLNTKNDLKHFVNGEKYAKREYNLSDWDYNYKRIDGVALYENELDGKFWKLKYEQFFDNASFQDLLIEDAILLYQPLTQAQSDAIITEYGR